MRLRELHDNLAEYDVAYSPFNSEILAEGVALPKKVVLVCSVVIGASWRVDYCGGIGGIRGALLPVHADVVIHQKAYLHVHLDHIVESDGPDVKFMLNIY